jgi:two-component system cell cycle response regulator
MDQSTALVFCTKVGMDTELMADILSCPSLPSLPAVAVKVLELTSDPDIKIDELAKQIKLDQAMATKILRTVNSSFYGLRKRCSSIEKALVYLVLGFSLVSALNESEDERFDFMSYWQRGLHTAIAGKLIAEKAGYKDIADEAFLAGLCQDIGMIAMYKTIGYEYLEVMKRAEGNHSKLSKFELESFELHHLGVGAALAEKWRLPDEIGMPIKFHERPTACPTEHSKTARCLALGNLVHAILITEDPTEPLREAYRRAEMWLGIKMSEFDVILLKAGDSARELASLFELEIGAPPSAEEVLAKADRQLIELSREQRVESYNTQELRSLLVGEEGIDPVTGVFTREGFNQGVRKAFLPAANGDIDLTIIQLVLTGLAELDNSYGHEQHDEVVLGTIVMLQKNFESMGGVVCRLADAVFAVVLPQVDRQTATRVADESCCEFGGSLKTWLPEIDGIDSMIRVSIGISTLDDETRKVFSTPELLVTAAGRAVQAAKMAQISAVRAFVPRRKAA